MNPMLLLVTASLPEVNCRDYWPVSAETGVRREEGEEEEKNMGKGEFIEWICLLIPTWLTGGKEGGCTQWDCSDR